MPKYLWVIFLFIINMRVYANTELTDSISRVGACATPGQAWDVYVRDTIAYVADGLGFTTVNISDCSYPLIIGNITDPEARSFGVFIEDTVAYHNSSGWVNVFSTISISNPASLYVLGWCRIPVSPPIYPKGIIKVDTIVFLANGYDGLGIIDVSDPSDPDTIKYINTSGYLLDISVRDSLMFAVDYDSILVLNISDLVNPVQIGSVEMPSAGFGISVSGDYAYVACRSSFGMNGRLEIINVSDPTLPEIVCSVSDIRGNAVDVYVVGNYAYVVAADYWIPPKGEERKLIPLKRLDVIADIEGGLRIVDISDPDSARLILSYDTPGDPRGLFVDNDLIYVADYDSLLILRHLLTGIEDITFRLDTDNIPLLQITPSPFSSSTKINYYLSDCSSITLDIYDINGRKIRNLLSRVENPGLHSIIWDATDKLGKKVSEGVYFCFLVIDSNIISRKIIVSH